MACITKNVLNNGSTSYSIQVKVKDVVLGKTITKNMTWRKPSDMTEFKAKREVERIALEFEDKIRKQASGILTQENDIKFIDYANEWLKRTKKTQSPAYYVRGRECIKVIYKYFGDIKLKEITPTLVQRFIDKLTDHKVVMETAVMKKSLRLYIKSHKISVVRMKQNIGVDKHVYQASQRGEPILLDNAKKLCKGLKVDFNEYFDIIRKEHNYAKESILKYKRCLSAILATAKKQRLVEHNFASGEFLIPIKGKKTEVPILNDEEAKILKNYLDNEETNIKWKTSIYILLFMGLRKSELAGLEWKDIDFENKTMHIQRACYYVDKEFGVVTKGTKTFGSTRLLTMPDTLVKVLKEYKEWYDTMKVAFGDLWERTDRLMVSDDGHPVFPDLYLIWLKKILKKANLKNVSLHSLRHTNITLQLTAGVDIKTVSARAGHARASTTTDIYSHYMKNSDSHACKVLDDIFTNNGEENNG